MFDNNTDSAPVKQFRLKNGLQVLVYPYHVIPWVSTQLWYRVGSKHEKDGQRGAAHLLEHMLFKGTQRMSELDITAITDALSGHTNAFTSNDYTAYLFDFPRSNWTAALDMLADTMVHATIKPDLLHAELAAVIQELRLYNDDHESTLHEMLIGDVFAGHPYHYPVIGYRHDLWRMTSDALTQFYKQWYMPNNAVLVVVGDVTIAEVEKQAERFFGHIPAGRLPQHTRELWQPKMISRSIRLEYDIQQLYDTTACVVPGFSHGKHEILSTLGSILADGTSSRLYKRLVRTEIALSVASSSADLEEYDLFCINTEHEDEGQRGEIRAAIRHELDDLALHGPTRDELERAYARACMEYQELFQEMQELAAVIGQGFMATGDPSYGLRKPNADHAQSARDIQEYVRQFNRPAQTHFGQLSSLSQGEEHFWHMNQRIHDAHDESFIAARVRHTPLEPLQYALSIKASACDEITFPTCTKQTIAHNSTVITCVTKNTATVVLLATFPVSYYHEPEDMAGIAELTARLMIDGTKGYTPDEFADLIERRGMSLESGPGFIALTLLSHDLDYGIQLLVDIIARPAFNVRSFNRIRTQMMAELDELYDDPYSCIDQYARDAVYGSHPYGRLSLGNKKSLKKMKLEDVRAWHKHAYQTYGSTITIVGDCNEQHAGALLDKQWATLSAKHHQIPELPPVEPSVATTRTYTMSRDQTALCYARLSVERNDELYDALLLLDQIVCGGELNSMYSLLFQVRERTGLFYTVAGSTLLHAGKYPGMVRIKTLVSPDSLTKTDAALKQALATCVDAITPQSIAKARNAIVAARMHLLLSNKQLATLIINLEQCGLTLEHELRLQQRLADISVDTVRAAAQKFLNPDHLARITVGR